MAQGTVWGRSIVNTFMNLRLPQKLRSRLGKRLSSPEERPGMERDMKHEILTLFFFERLLSLQPSETKCEPSRQWRSNSGGQARKPRHQRYLHPCDVIPNATEQILQKHILISHATSIFVAVLKAARWILKCYLRCFVLTWETEENFLKPTTHQAIV